MKADALAKVRFAYRRGRKHIHNTSWIVFEKVMTMGITFFVGIFIARYLGPTQYGILAYTISLVALFGIAGHAGLSGLVVRDLVKSPEDKKEILGTSFILKSAGYLIGFILILAFAVMTEERQSVNFWALIVLSFSLLFKPFDVIDFWFQSLLQAKHTAFSRIISVAAAAILNTLLIITGAKLLLFAVAPTMQSFFLAFALIIFLYRKSHIKITSWQFSADRSKKFVNEGWMIFLGALFAVVYLRIDKIMLKWIIDAEEVGVYAVAATLSEAWYFVPTAIVASFFPMLVRLKETNPKLYEQRLQQLLDLLFMIALLIAVVITLISRPLIIALYGQAYEQSAMILNVHIWAALFIFMRAVFSKWILIENALMFSLITQGIGGLINVILNWLLIPHYGGLGAAYATLASYAAASYFALLFHKKTIVMFKMMSKSFLGPLRYLKNYRDIFPH